MSSELIQMESIATVFFFYFFFSLKYNHLGLGENRLRRIEAKTVIISNFFPSYTLERYHIFISGTLAYYLIILKKRDLYLFISSPVLIYKFPSRY